MTKPRKTATATRPRPMMSKWRCSICRPLEALRRLAGARRAELGLRLAAGLRRAEVVLLEVLVEAMGGPAPFDGGRRTPPCRAVRLMREAGGSPPPPCAPLSPPPPAPPAPAAT